MNPAGSAPALQFGDETITDSYDIVQYLDKTYPTPSLKPPGNEEAEQVVGNIFNLFVAWAKHAKEPIASKAEAEFTAELQKIDSFLAGGAGPLLCGENWSVADCTLVPRLYHITAVAEHYLHYSQHKNMANLVKYTEFTFSSQEFKATDYPREWIIEGWKGYFQ